MELVWGRSRDRVRQVVEERKEQREYSRKKSLCEWAVWISNSPTSDGCEEPKVEQFVLASLIQTIQP